MDPHASFLTIPLYKLYYLDDLAGFDGLSRAELDAFESLYDEERRTGIIEAVAWAVEHADFDFASLLPNLPYPNREIHAYLCKVHRSLVAGAGG